MECKWSRDQALVALAEKSMAGETYQPSYIFLMITSSNHTFVLIHKPCIDDQNLQVINNFIWNIILTTYGDFPSTLIYHRTELI